MSMNAEVFELFIDGPELLRQAVAGLSTEQLKARPVPGKWSTLEVVCHLVDSEQVWCHRMKRAIAEDLPLLIGYNESQFTATMGYHDRDLAAELRLFEAMRVQMAEILKRIPEASWQRAGVHNERGLVTLAEMVRLEAEHVAGHVAHIAEKRRALNV